MMRVLLTGARGQLGRQLGETAPDRVALVAPDRGELDLAEPASILAAVRRHAPEVVVHAGAYTAVDRAESERELALRVNAEGTRALAEAAASVGARVLYLSTDYVFGHGHDRPISPTAERAPLNVYGESKARGEDAILEVLGAAGTVVRTSWVYGPVGHNFLRTMQRLMMEREHLRIVADQVAVPTSTKTLAEGVWALLEEPSAGSVVHLTDAGTASWFDFAVAIRDALRRAGRRPAVTRIEPIATEDYPAAAERPRYSRLHLDRPAPHWTERLVEVQAAADE
jgi:dTDP-4-dehydrorhamnose reductase